MLALKIAVIAYMYASVLTQPGHIFSKWKNFLDETLNVRYPDGSYMYRAHWLFDPLVGCALCVAGQMMLWTMIVIYFVPEFIKVVDCCFIIMFTIGIVHVFKNLDRK